VDWSKLATAVDTLVIFMGLKNLRAIVDQLVRAGREGSTPVAVVANGGGANQVVRAGTLDTIVAVVAAAPVSSPALIIIGDVVSLRQPLAGFQHANNMGDEVLSCVP